MRITTLAELTVDGRPVRGERLAAVVRALVENAGRPVPTTTLVDDVWDGDPPDDAAGAVQALVSRVRRLGLDVEATPGGYRLRGDGLDVDSARARRLVADARAALASDPRA
ncbi:AfsR/SARP family transcriptional regulator, partial [Cellulomonas massiliensis]|uniref:AfsR/SARP family transcriptional regulator n=1 Tax=Cellulomonas massiliensis TaxID=1465811 RepID=UPI00035CCC70